MFWCSFIEKISASHLYPSYLGDRDQEDGGLKPDRANSSLNTNLKISNTKQGWQSGLSGSALA
jgi:hypothetical protein